FEEIKKMVLYYKELNMYGIDSWDLSQEEIQEYREAIESYNELLQLHYSLENLQTLREFKEEENEDYQESLNDEELQNDLREWR
ncbi:acyl carrier protein, partial [Helicobacter pylori]